MAAMLPVLQLDHATIPMFERMQANGLPIDRAACRALADEMGTAMDDWRETLRCQLGYYCNPNSADQVREVIKSFLPQEDLDNLVLTPEGEISTGKKVIEALRGLHPSIDSIIEYRQCSKIRTTYAIPLAEEIDPPPPAEPFRARCNIRITRIPSGRIAASKRDEGGASSLTIPTRSEKGRRVRKCYRIDNDRLIREGQEPRVLLAADLSQIEFRVCAHESGDREMTRIFMAGEDLHLRTASQIFGLPEHALDKWKHRYPAKTAGFGILYGITAKGLLDQMRIAGQGAHWDEPRCQWLIDEWFRVFPGVEAYIGQTKAQVSRQGYVESMSGRRRYLPGAQSQLSWIREEAYRQAVSMRIQGTAQDLLKRAMIEIWGAYRRHWRTPGHRYAEPVLQVHDEVLNEVAERDAAEWKQTIIAAMTQTTTLRVPILASGGFATDWGSLEK
jgi:DNA polymerase-1